MVVFVVGGIGISGRRGPGVCIAAIAVDVLLTLSRNSLDALRDGSSHDRRLLLKQVVDLCPYQAEQDGL